MTRNDRTLNYLRQRIPSFDCIPGCHDCCGPVTTSSEEMARLPVKSEAVHEAALAELSCPHLGCNGCEVYAERPIICRLFGTTKSLPCPHGRGPERLTEQIVEERALKFLTETRQVLV